MNKAPNIASRIPPQSDNGVRTGDSDVGSVSWAASVTGLLSPTLSSKGGEGDAAGTRGKLNIGRCDRTFDIATAEIAAQAVAMIDVPTMAVGLLDRFAA